MPAVGRIHAAPRCFASGTEICKALVARRFDHETSNPNRSDKWLPPKGQRGMRTPGKLLALRSRSRAGERPPTRIDVLQHEDPRIRHAIRIYCRQRHRMRLRHTRATRELKPLQEQRHLVARQVVEIKRWRVSRQLRHGSKEQLSLLAHATSNGVIAATLSRSARRSRRSS